MIASFIIGYLISLLLSGHYVHKIRWKTLVFSSFCIWSLGVLGSGRAKRYNSFYILLFSRMITGCREAAFQVVAPPLIQDRGGNHAGLWLSIYLTGIPAGLTFGYVYASFIASSDKWGWDWAYYFLFIGSLPSLLVLLFVRDRSNGGILGGAEESLENGCSEGGVGPSDLLAVDETHSNRRKYTVSSEMKACISSPVLVTLSLGWAAIVGAVASIGTFGVPFVVALELFDNERMAASWLGALAAVAGIIGTPIGGRLADEILESYMGVAHDAKSGESVDDALRHPIIASMLSRINIILAVSMMFVFPTVVVKNAAIYLMLLLIGWILLCECCFKCTQLLQRLCLMLCRPDLFRVFLHSYDANRDQSHSNAGS